ncbi:MAG: bifunctional 23S rRNA (guanine(2069)-N(7))-methyltransferase RlmK/23S rRNA (guanine(2445)-N(2))-methyltransferase RlmL [Parafannyhessea sp.]|uniref:bifunctional 23S rRNA (guanine(2069)-N(7))-methyltransferase RlmK/23S rRNA (guanine(2445)-N(2))-methyltransferase RlmL n=1 Tax=Parafannyhessea sp. TaxID=2847324 RepID=UPI003F024766
MSDQTITTGGSGQDLEFFATCPKGFEHLLADELAALGVPHVRALRGQVGFAGGLEDAYRACLWSRMASRVTLVLARVDATSSDALYEGLSRIPWQDHVPAGATIAVEAHGTNAALRNTQFTAVRAKDAIVDAILARRGTRPMVDVRHADVSVAVRVGRERATVGIDLSGAPLFRRGYEAARSGRAPIAPLRPDYAAALLAAGGWYRSVRHGDSVLASVYDGAGSLLVEAAAQALDRAPGLLRTRWGFEGWGGHDADLWERLVAEARERAEAAGTRVVLLAHDTRAGAETAARHALRAAGMDVEPAFVDAGEMATRLGRACASGAPLVAMDLSWLDEGAVAAEAAAMSECVTAAAGVAGKAGTVVALAKDAALDSALGHEADGTVDVLVGQDDATIRTFGAEGLPREHPTVSVTVPGGRQASVPVLVDASDQFARRLQKVWRLRRKWAEREDVSCYRIYDADLPDYSVSIDLFQGSELMPARNGRGRWLQVYEYAAPKSVDATLARRRLLDVLAIAPRVIGVAPEDVFVRVRTHGKGGSQYAGESTAQREQAGGNGRDRHDGRGAGRRPGDGARVLLPRGAHLVDEGGLTFEVNFGTRLDCGIFLDHRETRSLVREMMKKTAGSKRFLNLFAYTGTATCYAADGGAKHTTTVDMSRPSLEWARRNMERNGFVSRMRPPEHEYVQADVLAWVQEQRHSKNRWDLVFCDVPTFSNSSRMRGSWDVQRDHAELIIGISRLLTRNGSAIFSCNLRGFKPDVDKLARAGVSLEDITAETIPEDFQRNAKIHHCYIVRRTA